MYLKTPYYLTNGSLHYEAQMLSGLKKEGNV
jgi:hypothetical protein